MTKRLRRSLGARFLAMVGFWFLPRPAYSTWGESILRVCCCMGILMAGYWLHAAHYGPTEEESK